MILDQLLKPFPVESRLILSLWHRGPLEVSLVLQIKHHKAHVPLVRALESIKQLLHALNPILKGLGVKGAIINRWVVTRESFEHIGIVLLDLPLFNVH